MRQHPVTNKRQSKARFITLAELEEILAERRRERSIAVSALVATCVYACAKAWLPNHPEHVSKAMLWMQLHCEHTEDPDVACMLEETLAALGDLRPAYEPEYELVHHDVVVN
jgi:hypothetical protein